MSLQINEWIEVDFFKKHETNLICKYFGFKFSIIHKFLKMTKKRQILLLECQENNENLDDCYFRNIKLAKFVNIFSIINYTVYIKYTVGVNNVFRQSTVLDFLS